MSLSLLLCLPFLGSLLTLLLPTRARNAQAGVAGAVSYSSPVLVSKLVCSGSGASAARACGAWNSGRSQRM